MLNRAYSLLEIKSADDEKREITGLATAPTPDRLGDIVESDGAEFRLPLPFLRGHDTDQPIGHVTHAKVGKNGIEVKVKLVKTDEPGPLKDRLDLAWQEIKHGLVRGLSIGFKPLEEAQIDGTFSFRYLRWLWLELSAVVVPAHGDATISIIKSIDSQERAASGHTRKAVVQLIQTPGVSGKPDSAHRGSVQLIPR